MGKSLELLGLLEGARPTSNKLFITSAIAQESLLNAGGSDEDWNGVPSTPKADIYPTPAQIADHLMSTGQDVPCFLLPPSHHLHVPPHILAYSLMSNMASKGAAPRAEAIGSETDSDSDLRLRFLSACEKK